MSIATGAQYQWTPVAAGDVQDYGKGPHVVTVLPVSRFAEKANPPMVRVSLRNLIGGTVTVYVKVSELDPVK